MPTPPAKPYWIDCLWEKHECWTYDDPKSMPIELDGRTIHLLFPAYLPSFKPVTSARAGELIYILGRLIDDEEEPFDFAGPLGVSIVARGHPDGTYSAVIWHEHYPYVFKYLGLAQMIESGIETNPSTREPAAAPEIETNAAETRAGEGQTDG
jgi:hypothetical protein